MSTPPSFPPEQASSYGPIPNHMVWAILITIASFCLCCVVGAIPGVVAIVFASQVNSNLAAGDRADFVQFRFDSEAHRIDVLATWVDGNQVYGAS